jgi:hypothetical protein
VGDGRRADSSTRFPGASSLYPEHFDIPSEGNSDQGYILMKCHKDPQILRPGCDDVT